jgi:hypothetical protein
MAQWIQAQSSTRHVRVGEVVDGQEALPSGFVRPRANTDDIARGSSRRPEPIIRRTVARDLSRPADLAIT